MSFELLLTVPLLVLIFAVFIFFLFQERKKQRARGVQLLQAFRMLVKHIQMHRGLAAVSLGGDESHRHALFEVAASVANDIETIVGIEMLITDNEDWQGITRHWAKLSRVTLSDDVYDSYEQHCKLVAACIEIMRWVSVEYGVQGRIKETKQIYWYELLLLGEMLGQLRALGVIWLTFSNESSLRARCRQKISQCLMAFEKVYFNKKLQERIGIGKCEEINNFTASVEYYIVDNTAWISVDRYFLRASETIEVIYVGFDEEMFRLLKFF